MPASAPLVAIIDSAWSVGCPAAAPSKDFWAHFAPALIADRVISFDDKKSRANIAARGLAFEHAEDFDWSTAVIEYDRRKDYGEERFVATGRIGDRLHVLVFTHRDADIRVISLRRANKREQAAYDR